MGFPSLPILYSLGRAQLADNCTVAVQLRRNRLNGLPL